jgi:hypothetical protein
MLNRIWLDNSGINCNLDQAGSLPFCEGRYFDPNEPVEIFPDMTDFFAANGTARDPDRQVPEQVTNKASDPWRRFSDMIEGDRTWVRLQMPEQPVLAPDQIQSLIGPADPAFQAIANPAEAARFLANDEGQSPTQGPEKGRFADPGRSYQQNILSLGMQSPQFFK